MNHLVIAGHLGADPETRFTPTGKKVTTLRIATHTRRNSADDTIWYRVTLWGDQFDKMISFLKRGSAIVVCGDLQKPEIFTDRDGKPQISLNVTASHIQFSPFGKSDRASSGEAGQGAAATPSSGSSFGDAPSSYGPSPAQQAGKAPMMQSPQSSSTYDDEIPF